MKYILTILVILGALTLATLNYHFILLNDNPIEIKVLKKVELTLASTFLDGRGFYNRAILFTNPLLLQAGIKELFNDEKNREKPKK